MVSSALSLQGDFNQDLLDPNSSTYTEMVGDFKILVSLINTFVLYINCRK